MEFVEFVEFVDGRRESLRRTAWALTGDAQLAEDLVQTALMKVWPRWARLVEHGDPEAYVRKTIYTTYVGWWHRRWRGEVPTERLPERPTPDGSADLRLTLMAALRGLPRRQRATVVCRFLDDLSEQETAEMLGCSIGTVKSQTSRALARLRADLDLEESIDSEKRP